MIHFLRNKDNKTIISSDVYKNDVNTSVDVLQYTTEFLSQGHRSSVYGMRFAMAIDNLSEIRGLWWEMEKNKNVWENIDAFVASQYKETAAKFKLKYITD